MAAIDGGASVVRLWLEVDLESEPIAGTLSGPEDGATPFVGWLGLTVALEEVRKGVRASSSTEILLSPFDDQLTRAERDIVNLVCLGLTNPQIAERLFISRRTVQGHLARVFRKLGVRSRTELAALVVRSRVRDPSEVGPDGPKDFTPASQT